MVKNVLILPGFSAKNIDWAEQVAHNFLPQFEAKIHQWKHWRTGDKSDFSVKNEVEEIITQTAEYMATEISVLAKSIGTFVLAQVLQQSPHLFAKIILCGIPLNDLEKEEWNVYESFKYIDSRTICFQNDQDPHGDFAQVSNFFKEKNIQIPVVKKLADNHDYCYSDEFKSFLSA
jgi:hypothetical protein